MASIREVMDRVAPGMMEARGASRETRDAADDVVCEVGAPGYVEFRPGASLAALARIVGRPLKVEMCQTCDGECRHDVVRVGDGHCRAADPAARLLRRALVETQLESLRGRGIRHVENWSFDWARRDAAGLSVPKDAEEWTWDRDRFFRSVRTAMTLEDMTADHYSETELSELNRDLDTMLCLWMATCPSSTAYVEAGLGADCRQYFTSTTPTHVARFSMDEVSFMMRS